MSTIDEDRGEMEDTCMSEELLKSPLHDMVLSDNEIQTPQKSNTPKRPKRGSRNENSPLKEFEKSNTLSKKSPDTLKKEWPMLSKLGETLRRKKRLGDGSLENISDGNILEHSDNQNKNFKVMKSKNCTPTKGIMDDMKKSSTAEDKITKKSRLSNGDAGNTTPVKYDEPIRRSSRRSLGRASELASLRKAKYDS